MARMSSNPLEIVEVIGHVIDRFIPTVEMNITYPNKEHINNGVELYPPTITIAPKVLIPNAGDFKTFYTLVMTDPDFPGPSKPSLREHLHWIVTDIPGKTDATHGREVVSYESPIPHPGVHRYVFVLFKQKGNGSVVNIPAKRDLFKTRKFAAANELGLPVAAVYFIGRKEPARRR